MAEVHVPRPGGVDSLQRRAPGRPVRGLSGRQLGRVRVQVEGRRVGRVADQHLLTIGVDPHALVAGRVTWSGYRPDPGHDLRVTVQELESSPGEVEPVGQLWRLAPGPLQFGPLDEKGRVPEHRVLSAVVEVEMRVDDYLHVSRPDVMLAQHLRTRAIDVPPIRQPSLGTANAAVDQQTTVRMHDQEPMDGPLPAIDPLQARQVEPPYLQD